jgi:hypothetical protein
MASMRGEWSTMSLMPEDLAAAGETIIGRQLVLPTFIANVSDPAHVPRR